MAIEPPPEGSLDDRSLEAVLSILAEHSGYGQDTRCYAFYASLPANDFDNVHLWEGPVGPVRDLIADHGGLYDF